MATQGRTVRWLRIICALLAVTGVWALSRPALYDDLERPSNWFVLAFGLFGLYLFAYFALRGRLPKGLSPDKSRGTAPDGDA